jgi:DNA polymerase III epsilon subunit-like protein
MKFIHNKVIDTSVLFKRKNGTKMKLKFLADKILKVRLILIKRKIQHGTHDSKEDCLATLHLLQLKI